MPTTIDAALPRPPARDAQGVESQVQAWMSNPAFICMAGLVAIVFAVWIGIPIPPPEDAAAQMLLGP